MARARARVLIVPHLPRYAVVMAGGAGTRFWPRSRVHTPKQLLALRGERSLLRERVARVSPPIRRERVLVVTARSHARAVARQLPRRGRGALLVEPEGRNTAAAIALAALHVARQAPEAVLAVRPADHVIDDLPAFRRDLRLALEVAEQSAALVTIGVAPTHAETGYGYVRLGAPLPGTNRRGAGAAESIEKPERARAEALVAGGDALWTSGIFAWRASAILAALRRHLPEVVGPLERAGTSARALAAAYRRLPAVSIDHGVLERAERVAVVRARFPWSDVGSWAAVAALWSGELAPQGTLIYVMRYRSALDYLLVNAVLLREGLPLARFAPGVSTVAFRPLGELLGWLFRRRRRAGGGHAACSALVARGESVLLFMRSQAVAGRRRRALAAARPGPQYLRDVVRVAPAAGRPVFPVPVAVFRGQGFRRKESRLATLLYSVQEAPGEAKRFFNYLWNAEETQLTLGREIVLDRFVQDYRGEGDERIVRRLARALQIFLYREERLVWGPPLLPRRVVRRQVLRDPEVAPLGRRTR